MTGPEAQQFLAAIWKLSDGRVLAGLGLTILAGLAEGLSLMLLLPLVALAAPGAAGPNLALPLVGGWLGDSGLGIAPLLGVFVGFVAIQALLTRIKNLFNQRTMLLIAERLRLDLFTAMSLARWDAVQTRRGSDLSHTLTSDVDRVIGAVGSALTLFQAVFMLIVYLLLAVFVSWQMAAFATAVGGALFAVLYPLRRHAVRHGKELVALYMAETASVLEFIGSIRLAKLFTAEQQQVRAYSSHLARRRRAIVEYVGFTSWGAVMFQVGVAAMAAAFVWLAISVYVIAFANLAVLLVIFARVAPRFGSIQENSQQFLSEAPAFASYQAALEFFATNREDQNESGTPPPVLEEAIRLQGVGVEFAGSAEPSLDDVSIEIRAGSITALIGPSGSGKSTLADILLGLTGPHRGAVLVDDTPLDDSNRRAWRETVASVPQDAFLMNDTIAANLRLARPDAPDDELWRSLDQANIGELLRGLPEGLETMAGDRGTRFSGGERQRIALARALLRRPQLLILDEATSALDWENQQIIASAIRELRGHLTIVTIAHRPSLIAFADAVVTLERGKVAEQGSYADLKARPGSALSRMLAGEAAA